MNGVAWVRQVLDQLRGALGNDLLSEEEGRAAIYILKPAAEPAWHDHPDAAKVEKD